MHGTVLSDVTASQCGSLEMPNRCIRAIKVVRERPSLEAAPFQPPTTQLVSRRVSKMWCARLRRECVDDSLDRAPACRSMRKDEGVAWGGDDRTLDDVLQLPHIAGPRLPCQCVEHRSGITWISLRCRSANRLDEVPREKRNVFGPMAQGRDDDRKDVQAIVQIGTKRAPLHHLPKVLVGGRNHPNVDGDGTPTASQALDLLLLKRAKQLRLQFQTEGRRSRPGTACRDSQPRIAQPV